MLETTFVSDKFVNIRNQFEVANITVAGEILFSKKARNDQFSSKHRELFHSDCISLVWWYFGKESRPVWKLCFRSFTMASVLISLIKTKEGGPQWATTRLQGVQLELKNDTGPALVRCHSSIAYDLNDMSSTLTAIIFYITGSPLNFSIYFSIHHVQGPTLMVGER